jgi:hypothetical protein
MWQQATNLSLSLFFILLFLPHFNHTGDDDKSVFLLLLFKNRRVTEAEEMGSAAHATFTPTV